MHRIHHREPTLLIDDGGLGALVVSMTVDDPALLTPLVSPRRAADADAVRRAVAKRAEALGMGSPILAAGSPGSHDGPLWTPRALLAAMDAAAAGGFHAVVWPVHRGSDLDALMHTADLTRLVGALTLLELGAEAPRLETPLLDLTDEQIAELAIDADAPLDAGWWLADDATRWAAAFDAARARAGVTP
ncbi:MAG: hypothetical protein EA379_06675 [Phycisphaerales bacterium]|nr:MAG: hypothetical protein EA379_06675 [Phycisphaerales bacterium]